MTVGGSPIDKHMVAYRQALRQARWSDEHKIRVAEDRVKGPAIGEAYVQRWTAIS